MHDQTCWFSHDANCFEEIVVYSQRFLPIMAATVLVMLKSLCTALELSKMADQSSLTLCWHSLLEGGSNIVRQHFCGKMQPMRSLYDDIDELPWDYPYCKSNNSWHSVDAHLYDAAASMAHTFLAKKTCNSSSLAIWEYAACMLPESVRLIIVDTWFRLILNTS
jgi:hypothetical protein